MSSQHVTAANHRGLLSKRTTIASAFGPFLALLLGLSLGLAGCGQEEPPLELPPRAIQWARVSDTPGNASRVISGIVTAVSDTRLAFEVQGVVASVDVNFGDQVAKGQVLATLDPEPLQLTVRDAEAQLASARATFQDASLTFERATVLFEQDVASAAERDRAQARYDSTRSGVQAAERASDSPNAIFEDLLFEPPSTARSPFATSTAPRRSPRARSPSRWTAASPACASRCRCRRR